MALYGIVNNVSRIIVLSGDLSVTDTILENFGAIAGVAWAPDYQRLAYRSGGGLWIISRDGATTQEIAKPWETRVYFGASISWSPDASRIAYTAQSEHGCGIHILRLRDSNVQFVERDHDECAGGVVWSPDGAWLAYAAPLPNQPPPPFINFPIPYGIFLIRPSGRDDHFLTSANRLQGPLSWSPDSRRIAYTSNDAGPQDVWTVDIRTGERTRVTDATGTEDFFPQWSPDGTSIRFVRGRFLDWSISEVDATGGSPRALTSLPYPLTLTW